MKTCPKCHETKLLDDFPKNKARADGHSGSCFECQRRYIREHYVQNRDYYLRKARANTDRILQEVRTIKESSPCVDCGRFGPYYAMDFDHLEDKVGNVSSLARRLGRKRVLAEIGKCELVCAYCHRIRTWQRTQ